MMCDIFIRKNIELNFFIRSLPKDRSNSLRTLHTMYRMKYVFDNSENFAFSNNSIKTFKNRFE